jgi:hypothetical protein
MVEFAGPGLPLTQRGIDAVTTTLGIEPAALWAVLAVETSGCGFLPDRRPKILFERHVFSRLTAHRYDADDPDVSQPAAGGYGPGGAYQYERLMAAIQLDRAAALQSASWGLGQIMGENHDASGFAGVAEMAAAMTASEDRQLAAMAAYLQATQRSELLRRHDWSGFARLYNGPNYAAHNYDGLLQQFHARYSAGPLPDLRVRAAQAYLQYRGFLSGVIDGVPGPATARAVRAFQGSIDVAESGTIDDALIARLSACDPPPHPPLRGAPLSAP